MSVKLADTLKPLGDFEVAESQDISIKLKDETSTSIQDAYDNGLLGGGSGLPLPEQAGMVMISYEKEEGDLDWKQSLLKSVEKVTEIPTTFEDKVYVVDAEGTATKIGYPPKNRNLDEMADFINQKLIEIGATEDIVTISLLEKGNYYILLDLEYDDTKYELMRKTYNDETGRVDIKHNIHVVGYETGGYWDFDSPDKPHQLARLTEYSVDLIFIDKNKKIPSQVYASEVELATKEYADTHGAGAQVYTKAEWNALSVKPPAGTQVIISDDTSAGGGGTVTESKLKATKLKNNYYVATADAWTNVTLSQSINSFGALGFSVSPSDVGMECASQTILPVDYFKQSSKTNPVVINFNAANDTTTYKFMVYYINDTTVAVYRGSNVYQYHRFNMVGLTGGITGGGESGAIATVSKTLTVTFADWLAQVTPAQLGVSDPTEYIWSVKSPHWEQVVYIDHVKSDFVQLRALEMSDSTGDAKIYLKKEGTITNVEFNGVQRNATTGNKDIYSTDEALTDKVWIDGKPIYRKVLSYPTTGSKDVSTLNIDSIISFDFKSIDSGATFFNGSVPTSTNTIKSNAYINKNKTTIGLEWEHSGYTLEKFEIVIEYTKK